MISRPRSRRARPWCGSAAPCSATVHVAGPTVDQTRFGLQEGPMSMLRKAMHYLGLAPDDEYVDDYADESVPVGGRGAYVPPEPPEQALAPAVRPLARSEQSGPVPAVRVTSGVVRPLTPQGSAKPYAMSPTSFNEAQ